MLAIVYAESFAAFAGPLLGASSPIVGSPRDSTGTGFAHEFLGVAPPTANSMVPTNSIAKISRTNGELRFRFISLRTSVPAKLLAGGGQVPQLGDMRVSGRARSDIGLN